MDESGIAQRKEHVWMISCRSTQSLDVFAKRLLLFQPDTRAFCPRGKLCPYQNDEVHSALYLHTRRERDRTETELLNSVEGNPRIPHVSHAFILSPTDNASLQEPIAGFPSNGIFVVFVHGFSETFPRIIAYLNHLEDALAKSAPLISLPVRRCGFAWPSQSVSYFRARLFAEKAAKLLGKALAILRAHGNRIILVAHSMGCRVSLHALLDNSVAWVDHLFLIGAGVAADSLNSDGQFPAERLAARKVTVMFSKRDALLKSSFPMAEFLPGLWNFRPIAATKALGVMGLASGSRDSKVRELDCSSEVSGHSTHFYLNSSIALEALRCSVVDLAQSQPKL